MEQSHWVVKFAQQKLPKYYYYAAPTTGLRRISRHILDPFPTLWSCSKVAQRNGYQSRWRHYIYYSISEAISEACGQRNLRETLATVRRIIPKEMRTTTPSSPQRLLDLVNLPFIHMIYSAMMINTRRLMMWLKWHPDAVIAQQAHSQLQGSIELTGCISKELGAS
jgi:hypothetical protein